MFAGADGSILLPVSSRFGGDLGRVFIAGPALCPRPRNHRPDISSVNGGRLGLLVRLLIGPVWFFFLKKIGSCGFVWRGEKSRALYFGLV